MDRIIPLQDRHRETQELLPWYVTGMLDGAERLMVEAHLASCPECQADLASERRLRSQVAALPLDTELSWAAFCQQLEGTQAPIGLPAPLAGRAAPTPAPRTGMVSAIARTLARPGRSGWIITAQAAGLLLVATLAIPTLTRPAAYHTLSAPQSSAPARGNLIAMFSPGTPERDIRHALTENGARLVSGPTEAGAYIAAVPASRRAAVLAKLRARPGIVMAEPIDAGPHP